MVKIFVLGADRQAAISLASAYPQHSVVFASDQPIVDGSDLGNVSMMFATPAQAATLADKFDDVIALCPRWIQRDYGLTTTFARLQQTIPGHLLPVDDKLPSSGPWIVKGDRRHRPDAPLVGDSEDLADITDLNDCGLVYQPYTKAQSTVMAIGRRHDSGAIQVGLVEVLEERFFYDVILQAGETVAAPDILEASLRVLEALDHRGFFTLNWLRTGDGLKLSSFRPVPRAAFQTFLRGGVDLLGQASGVQVAAPGLRFVANPHYVSYKRLTP
jgi:hypothetical protein